MGITFWDMNTSAPKFPRVKNSSGVAWTYPQYYSFWAFAFSTIIQWTYKKAGWHAKCARYQTSIKFSSCLLLLNFRSSTQYRKNIQIPHASPGWWRRRRTRAPSSDSNKISTRRITKNHRMNITILYSQCNIVK